MNEYPEVEVDKSPLVLGIVVILVGVGLFVYFLLTGIFHITDNLTQVLVPGEADLSLRANLKYTIFLEEQSVVNGQIFSIRQTPNGLKCHVQGESTSAEVPLRPSQTSLNYNVNGRSGHSVLEFTPQAAGTYHLTCGYEEGQLGPKVVLAVGSGFGQKLVSTLIKCFAAMFGGGILGAVLLISAFRKLQRAKKQMSSGPQPIG